VGPRTALVVLVAAAGLAGAIAGMPVGEQVFRYTWTDPRFCDDCHVHDYANQAWTESVHGGVTTCHDCHRVPVSHYPNNLYKAIFDRPQGMEDLSIPEVESVVCEQCHVAQGASQTLTGPLPEATRRRVVKVDDSPLHTLHRAASTRDPQPYRGSEAEGPADEGRIECVDCHGVEANRAHSFQAVDENCLACHTALEPTSERIKRLGCQGCHLGAFVGAPGRPSLRTRPEH